VIATAPAIDGDHAIVGFSDGTVRAYATSDGSEVWAARTNAPLYFTVAPAVAPDAVVAVDSLGQVYRLDPGTGEPVWEHAPNRPGVPGAPAVPGGNTSPWAATRAAIAPIVKRVGSKPAATSSQ